MSSDPAAAPKYFVVINGAPQGPHTATQVMALWKAGTVTNETFICEEGAAAWVTLKEFEPVLRSNLPLVAPAGYGSAPAPSARPQPQPVTMEDKDNTKAVRLSTILAALVLFFVPWLEVRCAGRPLMHQTGLDAILNQASKDDQIAAATKGGFPSKMPTDEMDENKMGEFAGNSILSGVALLATVAALGVAAGRTGRRASGMLAAVALSCLGIQAMIGFPAKRAVSKMMEDMNKSQAGMSPGMQEQQRMAQALFGISVEYTPWFYGELLLLAVTAAVGLSGEGQRRIVTVVR
jgi:hypothetical protein